VDRGTWQATVHRDTKSRTCLKGLSSHACINKSLRDWKDLKETEQEKPGAFDPQRRHVSDLSGLFSILWEEAGVSLDKRWHSWPGKLT